MPVSSTDLTTERMAYLENELIEAARWLSASGALISGIKAYRSATGASLKDSKDWCEKFRKPPTPNFNDARIQRLEDRVSNLERR